MQSSITIGGNAPFTREGQVYMRICGELVICRDNFPTPLSPCRAALVNQSVWIHLRARTELAVLGLFARMSPAIELKSCRLAC